MPQNLELLPKLKKIYINTNDISNIDHKILEKLSDFDMSYTFIDKKNKINYSTLNNEIIKTIKECKQSFDSNKRFLNI